MNELLEISNCYYNYALNVLKNNDLSKAINYLKKSLMLIPNNVDALNLMGICEYKICNFEKAYYFWNKSLIDYKSKKAMKYLNYLESDEFNIFINLYNKGIEGINKSNFDKAIEVFKVILEENKELIEPYFMISICYMKSGKLELSKELLKEAINLDISNIKYLNYLKEMDVSTTNSYKNYIVKKKKGIKLMGTIAVLTIFPFIYNYENKMSNYKQDIYNAEEILIKEVKEHNILKAEFETYKLNNSIIYDESKFINKNEMEIFLEAISLFKNNDYQNCLEKFMYISDKGEDNTLIGEAIFFTAVSAEKLNDFEIASKYYELYIEKFFGENYYDDTLYNYGLFLYSKGNIEMSKKILNKLAKEMPKSIFYNSKVKYIVK